MYEDALLLGWNSKKCLTLEQAARLIQDFAPDEDEIEAYEEPLRSPASFIRGFADRLHEAFGFLLGARHA